VSSDATPFHDDEIAAQRLAGFVTAGAGIRAFMPDEHCAFFVGLLWRLRPLSGVLRPYRADREGQLRVDSDRPGGPDSSLAHEFDGVAA
jgi:hypothetical protein